MKNIFPILIFSAILVQSCIKEDHFGLSSAGNILSIEFKNQNGSASINRSNDSVYVELANGTNLSQVQLTKLELSSFAASSRKVGDLVDFTSGSADFVVTSEDQSQTNWKVHVFEVGSNPQLPNSDFNQWYDSQKGYLEIGADVNSTIWGTSNPGVEFGGMDANVLQEEVSNDDFAIKMVTRYSSLAAVFKKPIASGSAFTGFFDVDNIDINDPEAAIDFGIPFTATPASFKLQYLYEAGPKNIDKNGNALSFPDSCDIYSVLERREGDQVKRVATAWLRTTGNGGDIQSIQVTYTYGELPARTPSYMLPKEGETYAALGETPTHINVVFASSAYGAEFQGAENSTLLVDNFELVYE
ncbi:PCMD domain-containing protein [Flammeovirgaceae bacterium SG7u.111]|nr:PCMD domain-containing protein [Flammeovirgaceae bacterium SG7u.132]WPO34983.1 PCMD domain-containing protein [Flammeovirgaceae bacterium SG7u.111]